MLVLKYVSLKKDIYNVRYYKMIRKNPNGHRRSNYFLYYSA